MGGLYLISTNQKGQDVPKAGEGTATHNDTNRLSNLIYKDNYGRLNVIGRERAN